MCSDLFQQKKVDVELNADWLMGIRKEGYLISITPFRLGQNRLLVRCLDPQGKRIFLHRDFYAIPFSKRWQKSSLQDYLECTNLYLSLIFEECKRQTLGTRLTFEQFPHVYFEDVVECANTGRKEKWEKYAQAEREKWRITTCKQLAAVYQQIWEDEGISCVFPILYVGR